MLKKDQNNYPDLISLAEASKLSGYHQDYLGALCRAGKLSGQKIGRNWVVSKSELEAFAKSGVPGAPVVPESPTVISEVVVPPTVSDPMVEVEYKLNQLRSVVHVRKVEHKLEMLEQAVQSLSERTVLTPLVQVPSEGALVAASSKTAPDLFVSAQKARELQSNFQSGFDLASGLKENAPADVLSEKNQRTQVA